MTECQPQKKWYLLLALTLLTTVLGARHFINEVEQIKSKTQFAVDNRADLFRQYINFMGVSSDSLKLDIENRLNSIQQAYQQTSTAQKIRFYPEFNLYSLDDSHSAQATGTLHILGDVDLKQPNILSEIAATLSIDPILKPLTNKLESTAWAYYTSKNHFLYIAPKHSLKDFQFNTEQYKKPFWAQAIPENNPEHRMIISDVYEDGAGKGMMITLSNPVLNHGEFKGVVSIDISTEHMNALLGVDSTIKNSRLIDENKIITASMQDREIGTLLEFNKTTSKNRWIPYSENLLYVTSVINQELYIVHQLTKSQLWQAALKESLFHWSLLAFGLILSLLSIQLYCVPLRNRELMLIDPLTELYNRRGFTTLSRKLIAQSKRNQNGYAILLADIDLFKQINDQFGHSCGDIVLMELAKILKSTNREDSIISRWGGEEFQILLPDIDIDCALEVAKRLHAKIRQAEVVSPLHNNAVMRFTVSIGVALQNQDESLEDVINHADKALYQSKENGRNTTTVYQSR